MFESLQKSPPFVEHPEALQLKSDWRNGRTQEAMVIHIDWVPGHRRSIAHWDAIGIAEPWLIVHCAENDGLAIADCQTSSLDDIRFTADVQDPECFDILAEMIIAYLAII